MQFQVIEVGFMRTSHYVDDKHFNKIQVDKKGC